MQFSCVILPLVLILTEFLQNVLSKQASQEFLNKHGIIATIDGYIPRCSGCVVFGNDSLVIYGTMHVPDEKLDLLRRGGRFFLELCGGTPWDVLPCTTYLENWYSHCNFQDVFFYGCKSPDAAWRSRFCSCDDTKPKRWNALIIRNYFMREDMIARFVFLENTPRLGPRYPLAPESTLYFKEIIARGHIVYPDKLNSTVEHSRRLSGSTSWAPDFVLEMTSVALVFSAVGFITN